MSTTVEAVPTAAELGIGVATHLGVGQRATNRNWTLAPYNRWTFQRVQQFTRTLRVSRAPQTAPLKGSLGELGSQSFTDSAGTVTTVDQMLERTWTDAFLVMHRGEVVCEQYFNGMRPDTLHLMMSCSKSFTSALAGIFVQQGVLDTSKLLTDYLPELAHTGFAGATLQQAMDMRVGVKFDEDYSDLDGDWRQCEVATGWRDAEEGETGPKDMLGYMQTLDVQASDHGGTFHYQSILTDVIGLCLERATGGNFSELFEEHIWHPLGAEQDLVTICDSAGNAVFEGGFNVCLRDFSRFAQMICDGGRVGDQQLVPEAWIHTCRFPGAELVEAFKHSDYGDVLPNHAYHNQWWVRNPRRGVIMALGIHGQTLYIDPENEFVVAKFSSQPEQDDIAMAVDQMLAFDALSSLLSAS